jgi:hypothetical protein
MPGIAVLVVSCVLAVEPAAVEPPASSALGAEDVQAPAHVDPGPHKSRIERIIVEGALGGVAGAAGVLIGLLAGGGFSSQFALYTTLIGGSLGLTAGVLGGGYLMDGNGSWLATLAGAAGGVVAAYAIMTASALVSSLGGPGSPFATYAGVLVSAALPTLAAVIPYEVTSADSRTRVEREQQALRVFPSIGPSGTGRGVVFGLGLRF